MRQRACASACARVFFALLLRRVAACANDRVMMSSRSCARPSAVFDTPRRHLRSTEIRTVNHLRRSGEHEVLWMRKDGVNSDFHNGWHAVEGATAFSPQPWSRLPPRTLPRAILMERLRFQVAENRPSFLPTLFLPTNSPGHALHRLAGQI